MSDLGAKKCVKNTVRYGTFSFSEAGCTRELLSNQIQMTQPLFINWIRTLSCWSSTAFSPPSQTCRRTILLFIWLSYIHLQTELNLEGFTRSEPAQVLLKGGGGVCGSPFLCLINFGYLICPTTFCRLLWRLPSHIHLHLNLGLSCKQTWTQTHRKASKRTSTVWNACQRTKGYSFKNDLKSFQRFVRPGSTQTDQAQDRRKPTGNPGFVSGETETETFPEWTEMSGSCLIISVSGLLIKCKVFK